MDRFALAVANRLAGNQPYVPAFEITAGGTQIRCSTTITIGLAGADLQARLNDTPLVPWHSAVAPAGSTITFGGRRGGWGGRAYLAVAGEPVVEWAIGGAGTCLAGGFGGYQGRALRAGDRIAVQARPAMAVDGMRWWPVDRRPPYGPQPRLRVIPRSSCG